MHGTKTLTLIAAAVLMTATAACGTSSDQGTSAAGQAPASASAPALEAARQADLGEFTDLPDAERLVLNLHRAYADADDADINIAAALGDAIAYNGGPLACSV